MLKTAAATTRAYSTAIVKHQPVCGCWSSGAAGPVASTLVRRRDACALEGAVGPHSAASLARIAEDFRTVRSLYTHTCVGG